MMDKNIHHRKTFEFNLNKNELTNYIASSEATFAFILTVAVAGWINLLSFVPSIK